MSKRVDDKNFWSSTDADYPRPQLKREKWLSLNGTWDFRYDDDRTYTTPAEVPSYPLKIQVPFCPESVASGLNDQSFHNACWYQRTFTIGAAVKGQRYHLHFGAVDYAARVWVNGIFQGNHEGGHTPFFFDVTDALRGRSEAPTKMAEQTITVYVEDDPQDLAKPRGKQDWQLAPHSIWYPRTTGIWQSVWLEEVANCHIEKIKWEPHLERWEIGCEVFVSQASGLKGNERLFLDVSLSACGKSLVNDRYEVLHSEVHRRIALSDPGIDDFRNELLWCPERPTLIDAELTLSRTVGNVDLEVFDRVISYTALRSVDTSRDRFTLNGRPYYLRMILDQGYWPDTLMTPTNSAACRKDIELIKAAGFNGARKHQKIESPWYLYWADRLGLIVWEEMPSAYRFTTKSVERITREWIEVIERDYNHPCICVWVPFNESWGVPDLALKAAHQNAVRALYHLTKTLDPNRLIVGNDGWEALATDLIGIHDYEYDPARMLERYGGGIKVAEVLKEKRPAGRVLTLDTDPQGGQPVLLTEFGGIAVSERSQNQAAQTWGYSVGADLLDLERRYQGLLRAVHSSEVFSGFCYTQFTDTFQEANGLFFADRSPKIPVPRLNAATHGLQLPDREAD